jgi:putative two-component system response regulator
VREALEKGSSDMVMAHSTENAAQGDTRVLIVEDDEQMVLLLGRLVADAGYPWSAAGSGAEARARLSEDRFSLLLVDVNMPGESGLDLIERALTETPDLAAIMVTGVDDPGLARRAIDLGAYGYIIKPFTHHEITIAIENAIRRRQLEVENRAQRAALEQTVRARTIALERSAHQLKLTREEMVRRLSRAVEYRDEETGGHTERMSRYCAVLAGRAGLDAESIRVASPMHDVGKVAIPDHILLKPGRLSPDERLEMERHTTIGYEILGGSGSALLELAATIALNHHEKFDGSGYPRRLAGSDIPLEGRVAAIADVFDALTSERSYRAAFAVEDALQLMSEERGGHFDPELLDLFMQSMEDVLRIRSEYADATPRTVGTGTVD